jgi:erythromycin esterase-like protein
MNPDETLDVVRDAARWFEPGLDGVAPIVEAIGDARIVLIDEASHGTDEFYRLRADVTAALIQDKGFTIVAAEADWPDAYRVNRWVRQLPDDADAVTALSDFTRFPRWMWRNEAVVQFISWLHEHNSRRPADGRAGFYGLGACLVGFTTHTGTVTAARDWDAPVEQRRVRPSLDGSYERLFHDTGIPRFFVDLREEPVRSALTPSRLERAIGVIYAPETERASHYFRARLARQFDVVIHVDDTHAVRPLERRAREDADVPETYPTGI